MPKPLPLAPPAAPGSLALALLRHAGHANVAAALGTYAGRPRAAITLVASAGCQVMK